MGRTIELLAQNANSMEFMTRDHSDRMTLLLAMSPDSVLLLIVERNVKFLATIARAELKRRSIYV